VIVEAFGNKLAFDLEWKPLLSGSHAQATQAAAAIKAKLMWHDSRVRAVGLLTERMGRRIGQLHSGAAAFLQLPGLPSNAFLLLKSADDRYIVVGVEQGRPRKGFDRSGLSEDQARDLLENFGKVCNQQGYVLVGQPAPFTEGKPVTPLTLKELGSLAGNASLLKPPSKAALYRYAVGCVLFAAAGAHFGPMIYDAAYPPPPPEQQMTPAELYQQSLAQHASDPILRAADFGDWYSWIRSLRPSYAGWNMSTVVCDWRDPTSQPTSYVAWNGKVRCVLEFKRGIKAVATNEGFMSAIPSEWSSSAVYDPASDAIRVSLQPAAGKAVPLSQMLRDAAPGHERDIHFVSLVQRAGNLSHTASLTGPSPFLLPPTAPAGAVPDLFMASKWQLTAPLHLAEFMAQFPPYVSLSTAKLEIADVEKSKDPFRLTVEGMAITRN
jgi:hypothetical protein